MRFDDLFISATGSQLAPRLSVADAVATGITPKHLVVRAEQQSVCVSEGESGPEMAAAAGRQAMRRSGVRPVDVGLVLHACTWYQGHDLWAPASFVQRHAVGNSCPSMEVRQLSNGGLAALELAASYLLADRARGNALITTGDRFAPPSIDRFATDPGTICGDGGTAAMLSTRRGFARVLSLASVSDPGLEAMGRGDDPFNAGPLDARTPVCVAGHRGSLVREYGVTPLVDRMRSGQREACATAFAEAGVGTDDIHRFVLPNLGRPKMAALFFEPLEIEPSRTLWPQWGAHVGHLGAGDQLGGLAHLVDCGELQPGDLVALVGVGAAFAWSVAVLEIVATPPVD